MSYYSSYAAYSSESAYSAYSTASSTYSSGSYGYGYGGSSAHHHSVTATARSETRGAEESAPTHRRLVSGLTLSSSTETRPSTRPETSEMSGGGGSSFLGWALPKMRLMVAVLSAW